MLNTALGKSASTHPGAFFTVQKTLPLLKSGGSIVLMSSIMNDRGYAGISVDAAPKSILGSFARN